MDTHLFLDIIRNEGALSIGCTDIDGLSMEIFIGPSQRRVYIVTADESISSFVAKTYLKQLGLESLIEPLTGIL